MEAYRILFERIEWHSPQPGVRFKVTRDGSKQVRLIEFTPDFVEREWCEKGHAGFVLAGELEIAFCGHAVRFPEGSALLIPAGTQHRHKARVLTPLVRLFLVEEVPAEEGHRVSGFHLAQANVARCRAPLDTPAMRDFVELLPAINALADGSHGFVWRLQTEGGDATAIRVYDDPLVIFNTSVWTGLAELSRYVFTSSHLHALRRRRDWFEPMDPSSVLWWVPAGCRPQVPEGKARLERLAADGPLPEAFTFAHPYPPPDAPDLDVSHLRAVSPA
jgi:quercetin dioxygenase-like cupin family protein